MISNEKKQMVKSSKCIICGNTVTTSLYDGILQCEVCSYVFANVHLSDAELAEIYRKNYFFGDEYSDYIADKRIIQKNFEKRFKVLKSFLDPNRHKRLFEIGSAYGFFLDLVRNRFEKVQGIDITEEGIRYSREELQLDVIQGDLLTSNLEDNFSDIVCLWDTIEHLQNPHLYLEKISQKLEPGALVAITTGDINSLNARLRKANWRLIHPPTHLHYFSQKTLTQILNKYDFDVIYKRYCGFHRSVDNVMYNILVLRYKQPGLYKLLKKLKLTSFDFYLNMYDIVYIIARKRA